MITLLLASMLIGYIYEDADSLIVYNDSLIICGLHHYNIKVTIAQNSKLTVRPWSGTADSTGWLYLDAPLISIEDSSLISGSGAGYYGGSTSDHPNGYGPGGGGSGTSGGGGGAGYGGAGGTGGDVTPGAGGITYGDVSDTLIDMGSGGGAGRLGFVDGVGSSGGASVFLRGKKICVDTSTIEVNGKHGNDGALEAGGGGSGGGIAIWSDSIALHSSTISVGGGDGGDAEFGGGGGAGGGRIKIFYSASFDTSELTVFRQGGAPGTGFYGNPEPGAIGSLYIGPVLGVTEIAQTPYVKFLIQPTVVRKTMTVIIDNPPHTVRLYDVSGRIVHVIAIVNTIEYIDLSDLQQGIYFVQLSGERSPTIKIILLK
ncbi:hypothetical protein AMJ52_05535 [candidate division TA06 bacterium DG_78]|uniref:Secretion system C-terminal sorting domain-containing protein n=1 Tax=candidate division TA06 bacterium DG_78 TaxID=1703772 RepID=A0A0S7YDC3_UNCT6|nr:MAG: hypothetical protein AMJ52_05535 [candidate division TA06 bacterium DG_78]